uniref:Uncharacterized protein LOC113786531 n=1 Tax=Cicer arietinum TaxID=3827 RepID=A0A3Q7X8R4_CICAR|nr:uncharacterized protein LOC113786531 [Cicer arietinum]
MSELLLSSPVKKVDGKMFHPTPVSVTNTNYQGTQHFANNIIFQHENAAFNEEIDPMIEYLINSFWKYEQDHSDILENSIMEESTRNESARTISNSQTPSDNRIETYLGANTPNDDSTGLTLHRSHTIG